jgi:hypothetical protein
MMEEVQSVIHHRQDLYDPNWNVNLRSSVTPLMNEAFLLFCVRTKTLKYYY